MEPEPSGKIYRVRFCAGLAAAGGPLAHVVVVPRNSVATRGRVSLLGKRMSGLRALGKFATHY
jgi:hypothetical protein